MNRKKTFACISLLLILLAGSATKTTAQEKRIKGPRLGFDVSGVVSHYLNPERLSLSAYADYEIMPAIYANVELGRMKINRKQPSFDYKANGYFAKIGADYNFLQYKLAPVAQYDMIYGGLRFCAARYTHQASQISLSSDYWGNHRGEDISKYTMQAYWAELVAGIRVEALKNFFLGWSIRGQVKLFSEEDPRMKTLRIPGYGKASRSSGLSFTYTISYRIPLTKVAAGKTTWR